LCSYGHQRLPRHRRLQSPHPTNKNQYRPHLSARCTILTAESIPVAWRSIKETSSKLSPNRRADGGMLNIFGQDKSVGSYLTAWPKSLSLMGDREQRTCRLFIWKLEKAVWAQRFRHMGRLLPSKCAASCARSSCSRPFAKTSRRYSENPTPCNSST
jgi:hypothetical protein